VGVTLEPETRPDTVTTTSGLSHTAYDLLRIGAWAPVIFGALPVVTGLIRYWADARASGRFGPS